MQKGRLTYEDLPGIYEQLSADLPIEAAEHVPGSVSRKGYDTTGYAYQFHVNRLNEVLFGHWRSIPELLPTENSKTSKGKNMYRKLIHMVIQIGNWVFENGESRFEVLMQVDGYGGHESLEESSAYKGAYTNAFKKVSAMLGVGKKAFEGQLDEDYQSYQMELKEKEREARQQKQTQAQKTKRTEEEKKAAGIKAIEEAAEKKGLHQDEMALIVLGETDKKGLESVDLDKLKEIYNLFTNTRTSDLKEIAKAHMIQQQATTVA